MLIAKCYDQSFLSPLALKQMYILQTSLMWFCNILCIITYFCFKLIFTFGKFWLWDLNPDLLALKMTPIPLSQSSLVDFYFISAWKYSVLYFWKISGSIMNFCCHLFIYFYTEVNLYITLNITSLINVIVDYFWYQVFHGRRVEIKFTRDASLWLATKIELCLFILGFEPDWGTVYHMENFPYMLVFLTLHSTFIISGFSQAKWLISVHEYVLYLMYKWSIVTGRQFSLPYSSEKDWGTERQLKKSPVCCTNYRSWENKPMSLLKLMTNTEEQLLKKMNPDSLPCYAPTAPCRAHLDCPNVHRSAPLFQQCSAAI